MNRLLGAGSVIGIDPLLHGARAVKNIADKLTPKNINIKVSVAVVTVVAVVTAVAVTLHCNCSCSCFYCVFCHF